MIEYLKNSLVTFGGQIARILFIAGSNVVIARYLGPSGKGTLTLIMNFLAVVLMLGMFGVDEANVYFISSNKASHRNVFANALFHTVFVSSLCISIFILSRNWFLHYPLKDIEIGFFYVTLCLIPCYFFAQHEKSILLGHRAIYTYNFLVILQVFLLFIIQLLFIPFIGIRGGILAIVISALIPVIVGFILLMKRGNPGRSIDFLLMKKSYAFGIKSQLGLVFSYMNQRLDFFLVNYFLNPYEVGIYAIAVSVAELPWHIPAASATVLFPWIAGKEKGEAARFTAYVIRNVLLITALVILVLALLGKILVTTLFGTPFVSAVLLLYILLPGILALGVTRILGAHFQGSGRPELGTLMVTFSFIETIILDFVLIPRMGARGAAIASTVAYITSSVIGLILFTRLWKIKISDVIVPRWHEITKIQDFLKILRVPKSV